MLLLTHSKNNDGVGIMKLKKNAEDLRKDWVGKEGVKEKNSLKIIGEKYKQGLLEEKPLEKTEKEGDDKKTKIEEKKKKLGLVKALVLSTGLALSSASGCGDEIYNYYYNCPDAQTQQDAVHEEDAAEVQEDAEMETDIPEEVSDVVGEDAMEEEVECVPDLSPPTCDPSEPVAEGVISREKSLEVGGIIFELFGTESQGEEAAAIIEAVDECGNVLKRNKYPEGNITEVTIEGATYIVTVNTVHVSETNPWADVSIKVKCDNMCEVASGILNMGESLSFGEYNMRLDDIDITEGRPAAVVSILDRNATFIYTRLKIPKWDYVYFEGYRIRADEVTAGYTFGAKWAQFTISGKCKE